MASCYYYCSYPASSFDPTDLDTEQWAQTGRYYCTALAPTHSVCQGQTHLAVALHADMNTDDAAHLFSQHSVGPRRQAGLPHHAPLWRLCAVAGAPVLSCPPPNPNPNPKLGPMLLCWASSDDLAGRRRPAASPRWVRFSSSDFHAGSCNIDDVIATLITFNSQANESEQLFNRSQPVRRDQT